MLRILPSPLSRLAAVAVACLLAVAVKAAATTPTAEASRSQVVFFEAPSQLLNPATRQAALTKLEYLGVNALRVEMPWATVTPDSDARHKPVFNATSPDSYSWGNYYSLISEAHQLGWKVLLSVTAPAPRWATSNRRAPYVTRPDDLDFRQFMTAVARQFRGTVSLYAIWNEPNERGYLQPQFDRKGNPVAGRIYRGLFQAGYQGIRSAGIRQPRVLMGETSPGGFSKLTKKTPKQTGVSPLTFMRGALCLNKHYKKAPTCGRLKPTGYAQHPYASNTKGPFYRPKNSQNVTIRVLGRMITALNRAAKAHAIRAHTPIYITEFGVMSKPNRSFGVNSATQAAYQAISERIAWEHGRVASFSQYLLTDDPLSDRQISFQTGLEYSNGRPKPLYRSFPVPITITTVKHGYDLWGHVRPAHKATRVTILIQRHPRQRYRVLRTVRTGASGYWRLHSNVKAKYWRVRWRSPEGVKYEGPPTKAFKRP